MVNYQNEDLNRLDFFETSKFETLTCRKLEVCNITGYKGTDHIMNFHLFITIKNRYF